MAVAWPVSRVLARALSGTALEHTTRKVGVQEVVIPDVFSLLLTGPTLPAELTYARASAGMRYNSSGVLVSELTDVARFDHDVSKSNAPMGLMMEPARTNLYTRSGDLTHGDWTLSSGILSVTNDAAHTFLDGVTPFYKVTENTTAGVSKSVTQTKAVTSGTTYTISVYVKYTGSRRFARVQASDGANNSIAYFDLLTGKCGTRTNAGTLAASIAHSIVSLGNDIFRITATITAVATTNYVFGFGFAAADGTGAYTGDGTSHMYMTCPQVEAGTIETSPLITAGATATRAASTCVMSGTPFTDNVMQADAVVYVEGRGKNTPDTALLRFLSVNDNSANEALILGIATGQIRGRITDGGVDQADFTLSGWRHRKNKKVALRYAANDAAISATYQTQGTDATVTLPTTTQANIGSAASGSQANGWVKEARFYRTAKTNQQLENLVRVGRVPSEFSSCRRWYDFTRDGFLSLSGASINTAIDQSGQGADITSTLTARPTRIVGLTQGGRQGMNCAFFDGSNDTLSGADAVFGGVSAQDRLYTAVMVCHPFNLDADSQFLWQLWENAGGSFAYNAGTLISTAFQHKKRENGGATNTLSTSLAPLLRPAIIMWIVNGTTTTIRVNGAVTDIDNDAQNVGVQNVDTFTLGNFANTTSVNSFEGYIGEFALFNDVLTSMEIADLETYLNYRWDLY